MLLGVGLLVACGGSSSGTATLTGGIRAIGRIAPGYTRRGYQHGDVRITRGRRVVASAHLTQGQGYRFALRPGAYTILSPPCVRKVKIPSSGTIRADVYCGYFTAAP
jgi:hypothetical protein